MLRRCYDGKHKEKHQTYKNCTVYNDWLYYPNFKKWYDENYYEIEGQRTELDKDILNKGNKVYSPINCVFVPKLINSLFIKNDANRGDLPIGIHWDKRSKKYQVQCHIFTPLSQESKQKYIAQFTTPQEAFNAYKKTKEEKIKLVADYYRDQIPEKLYEAMYRYEVHIDD